MRRIATCNEFFDILDQIKGGQYVTIGIVTSANLTGYPSIKRKNPLTNKMKGYPDHEAFGVAEEIAALVKVSSYNMHFSNRDKISKRYGDWKKSVNAIRNAYGVPEMGSRNSYKDTNNYGGGIESYNGDNESLKGHSYAPQNVFGVKPKSIVYAVNQDGHIIQALKPEQVKQYIKKYREYSPDAASYKDSGANALMKMGAEEEKIKEYLGKIAELKFSYVNFEANSILWIAASVNGEKIVYINDNFQRAVDNINIRPEDFRAIARKRYQIDLANLQEITNRRMNKQIIRLTESDLKQMVAESTKKILSELDWKTYASAARKNDEFRAKNPHTAHQWNRSYDFRNAAHDAFNKKYGLEGQYDKRYGGDKGAINLNSMDDFSISGSRDHDFGDGDPHGLRHNVYHMSKKYGKDGGYGRTRMWDYAHETTPEEFYGNNDMGKKFRDAEKDVEDFNSGKSHYINGKGWSNESKKKILK